MPAADSLALSAVYVDSPPLPRPSLPRSPEGRSERFRAFKQTALTTVQDLPSRGQERRFCYSVCYSASSRNRVFDSARGVGAFIKSTSVPPEHPPCRHWQVTNRENPWWTTRSPVKSRRNPTQARSPPPKSSAGPGCFSWSPPSISPPFASPQRYRWCVRRMNLEPGVRGEVDRGEASVRQSWGEVRGW